MTGGLTRGTVTINVEQCKGCELCSVVCPVDAIAMVEDDGD